MLWRRVDVPRSRVIHASARLSRILIELILYNNNNIYLLLRLTIRSIGNRPKSEFFPPRSISINQHDIITYTHALQLYRGLREHKSPVKKKKR